MRAYAIGCTHFGQAKIIELGHRPFASVEEMDETMIQNWNATVHPDDLVYHLGDFAWRNHDDYLAKLNGRIVRVQGNHDRANWGQDIIEVHDLWRKLVMFHYPIEEWNGWHKGNVHVHAHTHSPVLVSAPRRFNVSAEAVGYTPIALEALLTHPNAVWSGK